MPDEKYTIELLCDDAAAVRSALDLLGDDLDFESHIELRETEMANRYVSQACGFIRSGVGMLVKYDVSDEEVRAIFEIELRGRRRFEKQRRKESGNA